MPIDVSLWYDPNASDVIAADRLGELRQQERVRRNIVHEIIDDLIFAAQDLGAGEGIAQQRLNDLFTSFATDWTNYIIVADDTIITTIQNDATLGWLDTEYPPSSGTTIRERIIARLS